MTGAGSTMAARYIEEIERLAREFRDNERNLPLYFPDFECTDDGHPRGRVFGPPAGIRNADWPVYPRLPELLRRTGQITDWQPGDLRMEHVFTVDLRGLRLPAAPPEAEAMALFVSNAESHGAHQNGNVDTAVLFLTARELERGSYRGRLPRRSRARWSRRFALRQVDVPGDVFDPQDDDESPIALLQDAIWQAPARLGGCPMWVRVPNDPRDLPPPLTPARRHRVGVSGRNSFIMQFERRFADLDLGNNGMMYVSGTGAYYQDYPSEQTTVYAPNASLTW
jgi:hypothetical protein